LNLINKKIDKKYWETKIQKANELRTNTLSINNNNNVYRLVHAEGDYMPGCIIDIYNNVAVFQFHSIGMWKLKEVFSEIVQALMPKIELIYDKSEGTLSTKHKEEFSITNNVLFQKKELDKALVSENGNLFNIDWVKGQKTGFFIDQRENRKLLGELCKDKKSVKYILLFWWIFYLCT
jgi:23S rRNA (cytosine1962-C5)-methyltransferase